MAPSFRLRRAGRAGALPCSTRFCSDDTAPRPLGTDKRRRACRGSTAARARIARRPQRRRPDAGTRRVSPKTRLGRLRISSRFARSSRPEAGAATARRTHGHKTVSGALDSALSATCRPIAHCRRDHRSADGQVHDVPRDATPAPGFDAPVHALITGEREASATAASCAGKRAPRFGLVDKPIPMVTLPRARSPHGHARRPRSMCVTVDHDGEVMSRDRARHRRSSLSTVEVTISDCRLATSWNSRWKALAGELTPTSTIAPSP